MKIYVASSWRTPRHNEVVQALREDGHDVYDYRHPDPYMPFSWDDLDPGWRRWTHGNYQTALDTKTAQNAFIRDFEAIKWADVVFGVQPFGASAGLELGFARGFGKKTMLLESSDPVQPELMTLMITVRGASLDALRANIRGK